MRFKKESLFLFALFALLFSQLGFARTLTDQILNPKKPLIAGGAYHKKGVGGPLPLLLVTNDEGNSWSFVKNISARSPEYYTGMIMSASCNGNLCSAVGSGFNQLPLLVSTNKGQSWSLMRNISNLPPSFMEVLYSVNCAQNGCLAAGNYYSMETGTSVPLLVKSDSSGQMWSALTVSNLPTMQDAILSSVSCNKDVCVVVGNYKTDSASLPLVVVSDNAGDSWTFIKNIANQTSEIKLTDLESVNCVDETCIAAGNFNDNKINKPLLIVSTNNGKQWSMLQNFAGLPPDLEDGLFSSSSCTKNNCIVVGHYSNKTTFLPLLAFSEDKGSTWSLLNAISDTPKNMVSAKLIAVSCDGDTCIAAGYYGTENVGDPFRPYLIVSNDAGKTWTFKQNIKDLPARSLTLNTASCSGNVCVVAGEYQHIADVDLPPPLAVSHDSGQSWTFVKAITDFPTGLKGAEIFTLSGVSNIRQFSAISNKKLLPSVVK